MSSSLPLLIGGSGLVKGRVRGFGLALSELSYEISAEIQDSGLLANAPFRCISMIVRYGHDPSEHIQIGRVNGHGELEVVTEIAFDELKRASGEVSTLKATLEPCVRRAISSISDAFQLRASKPDDRRLNRPAGTGNFT